MDEAKKEYLKRQKRSEERNATAIAGRKNEKQRILAAEQERMSRHREIDERGAVVWKPAPAAGEEGKRE